MSCTYSVSRVAAPTHSTSTPVASGSSVPVWPTRVPRGNQRRARSTAPREVRPEGLSRTSKPCAASVVIARAVGAEGRLSAGGREQYNAGGRPVQSDAGGPAPVRARAGRTGMPPTDLCVIFNPAAGRRRAAGRLERLRRRWGARAEFRPTRGPGDAEELAAAAARDG